MAKAVSFEVFSRDIGFHVRDALATAFPGDAIVTASPAEISNAIKGLQLASHRVMDGSERLRWVDEKNERAGLVLSGRVTGGPLGMFMALHTSPWEQIPEIRWEGDRFEVQCQDAESAAEILARLRRNYDNLSAKIEQFAPEWDRIVEAEVSDLRTKADARAAERRMLREAASRVGIPFENEKESEPSETATEEDGGIGNALTQSPAIVRSAEIRAAAIADIEACIRRFEELQIDGGTEWELHIIHFSVIPHLRDAVHGLQLNPDMSQPLSAAAASSVERAREAVEDAYGVLRPETGSQFAVKALFQAAITALVQVVVESAQ